MTRGGTKAERVTLSENMTVISQHTLGLTMSTNLTSKPEVLPNPTINPYITQVSI